MTETLGGWRRSHSCGELRAEHVGRAVTLMGWAFRRRDHGGLIFIDLRDREGVTQCVFNPSENAEAHAAAQSVRSEFVLAVAGKVRPRPPGTENPKLPTGLVEIQVAEVKLLNESRPLPFPLEEEAEKGGEPKAGRGMVDETVRLKYRYLDLRRPIVYKNFVVRDQVCRAVRGHLHAHGFLEVETPFLTRSTPEGARDFLVPSRLERGSFYALPQSPQLFKQLLMVAGFERYFQIVRCFRDEDLRKDRQPEFTQIDIETSFLDRDDFLPLMEGLVAEIFKLVGGTELPLPFPRLTWAQAIERYGSDKPDLRFEMELRDVGDAFRGGEFRVFSEALAKGGAVKALRVPGAGSLSRKELDDLTSRAVELGAKGLAWAKVTSSGFQSPVSRFLDPSRALLLERFDARQGDLLLFLGDSMPLAATVLGRLRVDLAERLGVITAGQYRPLWVVDFPLFEYNDEEKRWDSMHHPFTAPRDEDLPLLDKDPGRVLAKAYDLVLNGQEIAGGSIRIHHPALQKRVFELLGIGEAEAQAKFGFLLEALEFGAPPMGGIAFGLDRLVAMLVGEDSVREVIVFPKTQKGRCPLTGAPAPVSLAQLKDLGIRLEGWEA